MNLCLDRTRIARYMNDESGAMIDIAWDGTQFRERKIILQYCKERPKHITCDGKVQDIVTELSELYELQQCVKRPEDRTFDTHPNPLLLMDHGPPWNSIIRNRTSCRAAIRTSVKKKQ